tara:strand:- start:13320 stop:14339 length:1020 start_codon:yes stop_codon:yes gene_type:complete
MSETQIINEEPNIPETQPQSQEDKFFGQTTEISNEIPEGLEVEVVDDTPEEDRRPKKAEDTTPDVDDEALDQEISDYSKRAGDRISKIKYEYHEERRAKEAATRESQEAVKRLQTLMTENQRLQAMIDQGGEVLNKQAYNNALWAKQNAQAAFKKAYEEGNADEMTKAQEMLAKATLAEQQSSQVAQSVQQEIVKQMPAPEQNQPQVDPDMQAWAQKNPWFMGTEPVHKEMTSYAMYVDQSLQARGVDPAAKSEEYYSEVDKEMRQRFPSFFGVPSSQQEIVEEVETTKRQPSTVVASATRDSGNKKPTQIRLTQTQVKVARQLGISPEQYANQLLKET